MSVVITAALVADVADERDGARQGVAAEGKGKWVEEELNARVGLSDCFPHARYAGIKMKYLISYTTDRYFDDEEGVLYRPEGHTLIVNAENKVKAFILAYQELTSKGCMVRTVGDYAGWKIGSSDGSNEELLDYAGLSTSEMKEI